MICFRKKYFLLTTALFLTEVFIALFLHDRFIRPYAGDFLVVILIYCFLRSFLNVSKIKIAVASLLFAYTIETLQYFSLVQKLGLQHSRIAKIILGSSFEWSDMLAYTLGIAVVIFAERVLSLKNKQYPLL